MKELVLLGLAVVLAGSGTLKLASPAATRNALAGFGFPAILLAPAWLGLAAVELGLAAGVAFGSPSATAGAAGLMLLFSLVLAAALRRGQRGMPCACFGARSRVSRAAALRSLALGAAFALCPLVPPGSPSLEGWLALGLAVALVAVLSLAIAVAGLARELGELKLRLPPRSALEIASEGPPVGERTTLIERFSLGDRARFALAVFSSEGCRLCRSLDEVVAAFRRDPLVSVEVFDEERDAETWRELGIPGSPFALALARDGTVGAKGTFNSFGQLESILATAERRAYEGALA